MKLKNRNNSISFKALRLILKKNRTDVRNYSRTISLQATFPSRVARILPHSATIPHYFIPNDVPSPCSLPSIQLPTKSSARPLIPPVIPQYRGSPTSSFNLPSLNLRTLSNFSPLPCSPIFLESSGPVVGIHRSSNYP